jgi:GTPase
MKLPQVVIVGRPNVGKSSVFNWLVGKRVAIVDPTAGVTRDRVSYLMHAAVEPQPGGATEAPVRFFELVDTGGIGVVDADQLTEHIEQQIETAIDSASVVLLVVDTLSGLTPLDQQVAERLRHVNVPIILVANKTDDPKHDPMADEFYRLGRGKLIRVSTKQNRNRAELLQLVLGQLPAPREDEPADAVEAVMKVAIVGRRNTGKSTFVNTLAKAERMIVSEVPGTTRDSVDVRFELDGKPFVAIDTPGLTRTKAVKTDLAFYSAHRAKRSIRRADVVLLFFDASQPISKVDKQLAQYVADQFKPCVFVVNKWDLYAGQVATEKWVDYLRDTFPTMSYVPIAFITGAAGKNVKALVNHAQMLFRQSLERLGTGQLNRLLRDALDRNPPPLYHNRRPKIYYATQAAVQPPTIVLFCNEPQAFSEPYRRYLLGVFRNYVRFAEVPIKLYLRKREAQDTRDEIDTSPSG